MTQISLIQELDTWLQANRTSLIERLQKLIALDTTTPQEDSARTTLMDLANSSGVELEVIPFHPDAAENQYYSPRPPALAPTPWASLRGSYKGPRSADRSPLLINGHVDVVPPNDGQMLKVEDRNDELNIYGRGACDTKGNIVLAFEALRFFRESKRTVNREIWVDLVSEEEITGNGTLSSILHGLPARDVLILEPTGLYQIVVIGTLAGIPNAA